MRPTSLYVGIQQGGFLSDRGSDWRCTYMRWKAILITENKSWLWKRYVAKQYRDGELIASYPADKLCEIDLTYFVK